ncbi:uncharacterized protein PF3D7_1120600 isoform X1 [Procambarus clarkii]|uniref:uncharacterized protein PF3D7_1120600 isoform X1 n=2 Tax=Procambarus clarkii TaxID=6728 RepID=UPI0037425583
MSAFENFGGEKNPEDIQREGIASDNQDCNNCKILNKKLSASRDWNKFYQQKLENTDKFLHIVADYERERQHNVELQLAYDQRSRETSYLRDSMANLLLEVEPLREKLRKMEKQLVDEKQKRENAENHEHNLSFTIEQQKHQISSLKEKVDTNLIEILEKKLATARSEIKRLKNSVDDKACEISELKEFISDRRQHFERNSKKVLWSLKLAETYGLLLDERDWLPGGTTSVEWNRLTSLLEVSESVLCSQYEEFRKKEEKRLRKNLVEIASLPSLESWLDDFDAGLNELYEDYDMKSFSKSVLAKEALQLDKLIQDNDEDKEINKEIGDLQKDLANSEGVITRKMAAVKGPEKKVAVKAPLEVKIPALPEERTKAKPRVQIQGKNKNEEMIKRLPSIMDSEDDDDDDDISYNKAVVQKSGNVLNSKTPEKKSFSVSSKRHDTTCLNKTKNSSSKMNTLHKVKKIKSDTDDSVPETKQILSVSPTQSSPQAHGVERTLENKKHNHDVSCVTQDGDYVINQILADMKPLAKLDCLESSFVLQDSDRSLHSEESKNQPTGNINKKHNTKVDILNDDDIFGPISDSDDECEPPPKKIVSRVSEGFSVTAITREGADSMLDDLGISDSDESNEEETLEINKSTHLLQRFRGSQSFSIDNEDGQDWHSSTTDDRDDGKDKKLDLVEPLTKSLKKSSRDPLVVPAGKDFSSAQSEVFSDSNKKIAESESTCMNTLSSKDQCAAHSSGGGGGGGGGGDGGGDLISHTSSDDHHTTQTSQDQSITHSSDNQSLALTSNYLSTTHSGNDESISLSANDQSTSHTTNDTSMSDNIDDQSSSCSSNTQRITHTRSNQSRSQKLGHSENSHPKTNECNLQDLGHVYNAVNDTSDVVDAAETPIKETKVIVEEHDQHLNSFNSADEVSTLKEKSVDNLETDQKLVCENGGSSYRSIEDIKLAYKQLLDQNRQVMSKTETREEMSDLRNNLGGRDLTGSKNNVMNTSEDQVSVTSTDIVPSNTQVEKIYENGIAPLSSTGDNDSREGVYTGDEEHGRPANNKFNTKNKDFGNGQHTSEKVSCIKGLDTIMVKQDKIKSEDIVLNTNGKNSKHSIQDTDTVNKNKWSRKEKVAFVKKSPINIPVPYSDSRGHQVNGKRAEVNSQGEDTNRLCVDVNNQNVNILKQLISPLSPVSPSKRPKSWLPSLPAKAGKLPRKSLFSEDAVNCDVNRVDSSDQVKMDCDASNLLKMEHEVRDQMRINHNNRDEARLDLPTLVEDPSIPPATRVDSVSNTQKDGTNVIHSGGVRPSAKEKQKSEQNKPQNVSGNEETLDVLHKACIFEAGISRHEKEERDSVNKEKTTEDTKLNGMKTSNTIVKDKGNPEVNCTVNLCNDDNTTENDCNNEATKNDHTNEATEKDCTNKATENDSTNETTENDSTNKATENDSTNETTENDSTNKTTENDSTNKATENDSTNKATENDSTNEATEKDCTNEATENDCTNKATENDCTNKATENDCTNKATEDDSKNKATEDDCANKPTENDSTNKPTENDSTNKATENDCTNTATEDDCTNKATEDDCTNTATEDDCTNKATEDDCTNTATEDDCTNTATEDYCTNKATEDDCTNTATEDDCTNTATEDDCTNKATEDDCTNKATEDDCTNKATEDDCTNKATENDSTNKATENDSTNKATENDNTNKATEDDCTNAATENDSKNRSTNEVNLQNGIPDTGPGSDKKSSICLARKTINYNSNDTANGHEEIKDGSAAELTCVSSDLSIDKKRKRLRSKSLSLVSERKYGLRSCASADRENKSSSPIKNKSSSLIKPKSSSPIKNKSSSPIKPKSSTPIKPKSSSPIKNKLKRELLASDTNDCSNKKMPSKSTNVAKKSKTFETEHDESFSGSVEAITENESEVDDAAERRRRQRSSCRIAELEKKKLINQEKMNEIFQTGKRKSGKFCVNHNIVESSAPSTENGYEAMSLCDEDQLVQDNSQPKPNNTEEMSLAIDLAKTEDQTLEEPSQTTTIQSKKVTFCWGPKLQAPAIVPVRKKVRFFLKKKLRNFIPDLYGSHTLAVFSLENRIWKQKRIKYSEVENEEAEKTDDKVSGDSFVDDCSGTKTELGNCRSIKREVDDRLVERPCNNFEAMSNEVVDRIIKGLHNNSEAISREVDDRIMKRPCNNSEAMSREVDDRLVKRLCNNSEALSRKVDDRLMKRPCNNSEAMRREDKEMSCSVTDKNSQPMLSKTSVKKIVDKELILTSNDESHKRTTRSNKIPDLFKSKKGLSRTSLFGSDSSCGSSSSSCPEESSPVEKRKCKRRKRVNATSSMKVKNNQMSDESSKRKNDSQSEISSLEMFSSDSDTCKKVKNLQPKSSNQSVVKKSNINRRKRCEIAKNIASKLVPSASEEDTDDEKLTPEEWKYHLGISDNDSFSSFEGFNKTQVKHVASDSDDSEIESSRVFSKRRKLTALKKTEPHRISNNITPKTGQSKNTGIKVCSKELSNVHSKQNNHVGTMSLRRKRPSSSGDGLDTAPESNISVGSGEGSNGDTTEKIVKYRRTCDRSSVQINNNSTQGLPAHSKESAFQIASRLKAAHMRTQVKKRTTILLNEFPESSEKQQRKKSLTNVSKLPEKHKWAHDASPEKHEEEVMATSEEHEWGHNAILEERGSRVSISEECNDQVSTPKEHGDHISSPEEHEHTALPGKHEVDNETSRKRVDQGEALERPAYSLEKKHRDSVLPKLLTSDSDDSEGTLQIDDPNDKCFSNNESMQHKNKLRWSSQDRNKVVEEGTTLIKKETVNASHPGILGSLARLGTLDRPRVVPKPKPVPTSQPPPSCKPIPASSGFVDGLFSKKSDCFKLDVSNDNIPKEGNKSDNVRTSNYQNKPILNTFNCSTRAVSYAERKEYPRQSDSKTFQTSLSGPSCSWYTNRAGSVDVQPPSFYSSSNALKSEPSSTLGSQKCLPNCQVEEQSTPLPQQASFSTGKFEEIESAAEQQEQCARIESTTAVPVPPLLEEQDGNYLEDLKDLISCNIHSKPWRTQMNNLCQSLQATQLVALLRNVVECILEGDPEEYTDRPMGLPPTLFKLFQVVCILELRLELPQFYLRQMIKRIIHNLISKPSVDLQPRSLACLSAWFAATVTVPDSRGVQQWELVRTFLLDLLFHHPGKVHLALLSAAHISRKLFYYGIKHRDYTGIEKVILWVSYHGEWIGCDNVRRKLIEWLEQHCSIRKHPPKQPSRLAHELLTQLADTSDKALMMNSVTSIVVLARWLGRVDTRKFVLTPLKKIISNKTQHDKKSVNQDDDEYMRADTEDSESLTQEIIQEIALLFSHLGKALKTECEVEPGAKGQDSQQGDVVMALNEGLLQLLRVTYKPSPTIP